MKNITLALVFLALMACNDKKGNTMENTEGQSPERPLIGGDRDEQGCLTAAGETWSRIKQDCVRIFTIGQRLNPVQTEVEAVISAFVLFSEDRSKLELFLPDQRETIILDRDGEGSYQKGPWTFDPKDSVLYRDGEKRYGAE